MFSIPRVAKMEHFLMKSFIPIDQNADISISDQSHRSHALFRTALSNTQVSKYTENPVPPAEQGSIWEKFDYFNSHGDLELNKQKRLYRQENVAYLMFI